MGAVQRLPQAPRTLSRWAGLAGLLALASLAAPASAWGRQADGPPSAERVASPRAAEVRLTSKTEYYDVSGATLDEVVDRLNGLRLEGPDGPPSQGLTRYHILPEWRPVASGGACRVERLNVKVTITVTLPRWPGVAGRPAEEQQRWSVIEHAIRSHEFGHREIVVAAADDLAARLRDMEARGCGTLGGVVESALHVADGRLRDAHAEFDRQTPSRLSSGGPGR